MANDEMINFEAVSAGCKTLADDTLRVQLDVAPGEAADAFKAFGMRGVNVVIVPLKDGHGRIKSAKPASAHSNKPDDKPRHGKFWQRLIASGFFRSPDVCHAIGSEAKFEEWIRNQPAIIGPDDYNPETGDIRNQPAHVRRVNEGAGTSRKPPYFAVPLSADAHSLQHQKGELYVFSYYYGNDNVQTVEQAKDWFAKKADHYRTEWASRALAHKLKPDMTSRSEVSRDRVWAWVQEMDLQVYWPLESFE